ncbi:unnamed protein product [Brachionus calyciflorus]|uniref:Corrinoid adenosyltransferase MMAB n=1 Tax=Brachionus calyciflorus TaxID=104777 RepID=A0A814N4U4_9BILA|nr:unnamed protein product [Brachionus calyciflorus]
MSRSINLLKIVQRSSLINLVRISPTQRHISNSKCILNQESTSNNQRKIKIYTKTGDKGTTSLFTGERRPKNDIFFDALGNTDELNSSLGLTREFCLEMAKNNPSLKETSELIEGLLVKIQSTLLDIGSHLATPRSKASSKQLERIANFDSSLTNELEKYIDKFETELPVLKNFILPSGGKCASGLHLSRSICRRLERSIQPLLQSKDLDPNVQAYINRLSDFLFVCARYIAMKEGRVETIYKKSN